MINISKLLENGKALDEIYKQQKESDNESDKMNASIPSLGTEGTNNKSSSYGYLNFVNFESP